MTVTSLSVVIPALDEAAWIGRTIDAVRRALPDAEVVVVDNASRDATTDVARQHGALLVLEPVRGVARARNAGARAASGQVLLFLDADTVVEPAFGAALEECLADTHCIGGAFVAELRARRPVIRVYLGMWRVLGRMFGMVQGAAQFCRRDAFHALGGYDERLHMGEDVDFVWRLRRLARLSGARTTIGRAGLVTTSARRYDQWPVWKSLLWTNPVVVALLRRRAGAWRSWYEAPPR